MEDFKPDSQHEPEAELPHEDQTTDDGHDRRKVAGDLKGDGIEILEDGE